MAGLQLPATPSATLVAAMGASAEVKLVTGSGGLGNATTPFVKAKAIYQSSTLDDLAKTSYSTSTYFTTNSEYFGSATWLDDYMLTALDATGQFEGTLAATRGDMAKARTQAVKKGAQDQILVNAAFGSLADATAAASWYAFYAFWTGDSPSGAPWARANKRCKNYATCGGFTTGANGELATANSKILLATINALDNPTANGASAKATAIAQAKVVYYQAALRYAYLMDNDISNDATTAEHQGEGGAFWRVIEAEMAAADAATSKFVTKFYDMATVPSGTDRYCPLAAMLHANMPGALAVSEMGTLQGSSVTLPNCPVITTADSEGAQKTTLVLTAPGAVEDYSAADIGASAAKALGVNPKSVAVTIAAVATSRRRKLQSSGGVTITIDVYTADAAAATAMETKLVDMAGTAALASTFLTEATGTTVTVTVEPAAPASVDAAAPVVEDAGGLGGGVIAAILIAVVVAILLVVGLVCFMKKKKPSNTKAHTDKRAGLDA